MTSSTAIATPGTATTAITTWDIDPAHARAEFKVRHMMISYTRGEFSGLSGVLKLDENDYTKSTVEASIPAASVNRSGAVENPTKPSSASRSILRNGYLLWPASRVALV